MNLKGATIIDDTDNDLVLSIPKAKREPAMSNTAQNFMKNAPGAGEVTADYSGQPAEQSVNSSPEVAAESAMDSSINKFSQKPETKVGDPYKVEQRPGGAVQFEEISIPAEYTNKKPVGPVSKPPEIYTEKMPTEIEKEDPDELAKNQAINVIQAAEKASDAAYGVGASAAQIPIEEFNQKNQVLEDLKRKNEEDRKRVQALADADEQTKKLVREEMEKGRSPEMTLGTRLMWGLSAFLAGIGGKAESVMQLLNAEMDRRAKAEATRVASLQKSLGKPMNAKEIEDLKKRIEARDDYILKNYVSKKLAESKSDKEAKRAAYLVSRIQEKQALSQNQIAKDNYNNSEKQRIEAQQKVGLAGTPSSTLVPKAAIKNRYDEAAWLPIPGMPNDKRTGSPVGIRLSGVNENTAKALKKEIITSKNFLTIAEKLEALYKKAGVAEFGGVLPTKIQNQADFYIGQLQAIKKDLLKLGQLTNSDFAFLEKMIPNKMISFRMEFGDKLPLLKQDVYSTMYNTLDSYGVPSEYHDRLIRPNLKQGPK